MHKKALIICLIGFFICVSSLVGTVFLWLDMQNTIAKNEQDHLNRENEVLTELVSVVVALEEIKNRQSVVEKTVESSDEILLTMSAIKEYNKNQVRKWKPKNRHQRPSIGGAKWQDPVPGSPPPNTP